MDRVGEIVRIHPGKQSRFREHHEIGVPLNGAYAFSAVFGLTLRTYYRYRDSGLRWDVADELACSINLHPVNVWGDAWLDLSEDEISLAS